MPNQLRYKIYIRFQYSNSALSKSKKVVSRIPITDSLNRKFSIITYDDGSKETVFEGKYKRE